MIKSKTKIDKQLKKKTNSELVETIILAKKNKGWNEIASIISSPRRLKIEINLDRLNGETKSGEIAVIPGKILSLGKIEKKIKAVALAFSEKAREKLNKAGCETLTILEEIKKNPEAKGIKVLR